MGAVAGLADCLAEIVVVDGSADDNARDAILRWARPRDLRFDLIYVRSPAGLTRQRNIGLDASTKEFVYFLDDDRYPRADFFSKLCQVLRDDCAHEVGAVCGSFLNEVGKPLDRRWKVRFFLRLVPRDAQPGMYYPTATSVPRSMVPAFTGVRRVEIVPGGATAFRREVFSKHRFSMFFDGYSQGEDLEMSLRIGKEWKLLWCGDAYVDHLHTPSGRTASLTKGRMEVRNRWFIWRRHTPRRRIIDRCRFWTDIPYIFVLDLARYITHPLQFWHRAHPAGIFLSSAECFVHPPRYSEPQRYVPYDFTLTPLTGG